MMFLVFDLNNKVLRFSNAGHNSFPGVELNNIGGTNYGKFLLEWNLPPLRFRRLGFPAFYSTWARIALFSLAIVTNVDAKSYRRTVLNLGSQLDFRVIMLSHLRATFSVGYATAFEHNQFMSKELMFSLKIL